MNVLDSPPRDVRKILIYALSSVLALALIGWGLWTLAHSGGKKPRKTISEVTQVRLITPPPPPPPKPKIEEVQKPQPQFKAVVPENRPPSPTPKSEAPPGPPALDAQGNGPGDAFGLEGRPGGGDFGNGGGGGGSAWGWYATLLQQRVQEVMQKQRRFKGVRFTAMIQVWLDGSGAPTRVELLQSTGKPEIDQALRESVIAMNRPPEPPPKDLPQPALLRVASS